MNCNIELSSHDRELIIFGLQMRKHYIETGDALLSAQDAKNCGQSKKIKALGSDQYMLLTKLDTLITKINNKPIFG